MKHPALPPPRPVRAVPQRPRALWVGFFGAWTVLVALVIWWLASHPLEPNLVITSSNAVAKPWAVRLREWFELMRVNFDWVWRWGLLAPYVVWLASRLVLEPGRYWRHGLMLAGIGVAFVTLSQALVRRMGVHHSVVMVVSSQSIRPDFPAKEEDRRKTAVALHPAAGRGELRLETNFVVRTNLVMRQWSTDGADHHILPGLPPDLQRLLQRSPASLTSEVLVALASNLPPELRESLRFSATAGTGGGGFGRIGATPLSVVMDGLAYLALLGVTHAVQYQRRYREREQQALLLASRLNEARLRALQAQLQPHFLFNALNGIATLVRRDPPAAYEMLTSLSDLLRLALSRSDRQEVPLREEMEFLDRYTEIQRMRFGDRLEVVQELAPEALDGLVPALLLQPLVENAIRHGIEPSPNPGCVRVTAARSGGWLVLSVEDNGVGLDADAQDSAALSIGKTESVPGPSAAQGGGVGLASVRERLDSLYPGCYEFRLGPGSAGGVRVDLRLPFRSIAEPARSLAGTHA